MTRRQAPHQRPAPASPHGRRQGAPSARRCRWPPRAVRRSWPRARRRGSSRTRLTARTAGSPIAMSSRTARGSSPARRRLTHGPLVRLADSCRRPTLRSVPYHAERMPLRARRERGQGRRRPSPAPAGPRRSAAVASATDAVASPRTRDSERPPCAAPEDPSPAPCGQGSDLAQMIAVDLCSACHGVSSSTTPRRRPRFASAGRTHSGGPDNARSGRPAAPLAYASRR